MAGVAAKIVVQAPSFNFGTACGGFFVCLTVLLGERCANLFFGLYLVMVADIFAAMIIDVRKRADPDLVKFTGLLLGKILRMLLIVPALAGELVLNALGFAQPERPLTLLAICGLIILECGLVLKKIRASEGDILPVRIVKRAIDALGERLEDTHEGSSD